MKHILSVTRCLIYYTFSNWFVRRTHGKTCNRNCPSLHPNNQNKRSKQNCHKRMFYLFSPLCMQVIPILCIQNVYVLGAWDSRQRQQTRHSSMCRSSHKSHFPSSWWSSLHGLQVTSRWRGDRSPRRNGDLMTLSCYWFNISVILGCEENWAIWLGSYMYMHSKRKHFSWGGGGGLFFKSLSQTYVEFLHSMHNVHEVSLEFHFSHWCTCISF